MPKAKANALVKYDEKLAELAKKGRKMVQNVGGGSFISFRGGNMSWQGKPIPENKINVIIIADIMENQFYEGDYDPENANSPMCYAFGEDVETIAPHEEVKEPISDLCSTCPNNEWGSASKGKGKACKEVRRLACIAENDLDDIAKAEVAYAKIPVTSLRSWAAFVRECDDKYNKPVFCFIAEMSLAKSPDPNELPGWRVMFQIVKEIDGELLGELIERNELESKKIGFPYPDMSQIAAAKPARKGPVTKGKARGTVRK